MDPEGTHIAPLWLLNYGQLRVKRRMRYMAYKFTWSHFETSTCASVIPTGYAQALMKDVPDLV